MSELPEKSDTVQKSKIAARIPHQSPPNGGDSFPPGEAKGAVAPVLQTTIYHSV